MPAQDIPPVSETASLRTLARLTFACFVGMLAVGLPLPVMGLYVSHDLGFNPSIAGASVGIQFLATVLTRGYAGRMADTLGGRPTVYRGIAGCALSGLLYMLASQLPLHEVGKLAVLGLGRLAVGFGESLLITGTLAWGLGLLGAQRSAKIMAWVGMAIYGALAIGAPIGLWLQEHGGFLSMGAVVFVLPGIAFLLINGIPSSVPRGGERRSFVSVVGRIWQHGVGLALQGIGFAVLGTFVSLYFDSRNWEGAGLALTCFGLTFATVRGVFSSFPDRFGPKRVAMVALLVEAAGLLVIYSASTATMALVGASITGMGSSLVFPSLGILVIRRVEPQVRATALGAYSAFQDIALGVTGPIIGLAIAGFGYSIAFLVAMLSALCGFVVVWKIRATT